MTTWWPPSRARRRGTRSSTTPTSPRRRAARSSGCSTGRRHRGHAGSSRSAPGGASSRSAPPAGARPSTRSPCRSSSSSSPSSGSPRPASPIGYGRAARLPRPRRRRGDVRRRAVGRDDRGGRPRVLGHLLPDHRPGPRARRPGRIQAITMPHDRMLATRGAQTWINKYIFPGGFLPSVEVIDQITRDETGAATDRAARDGQPLRRDAAPLGRARSSRSATPCWASASTTSSCGCGTSTSPTPRPGSPAATSTSAADLPREHP